MYRKKIDADKHMKEMVELHFGPDGSQYCKDLQERFPSINFRKDIGTMEDRIHLPVETDDTIRAHSAEYFVPRSILREKKEMYYGMSSGTTGPRKTVPWLKDTFDAMMDWFEWNFSIYGVKKGRDLLTYGPSGLFQRSMESVAHRLGARDMHVLNDNLGELKKLFADEKTKVKVARHIYETELKPILEKNDNIGVIITLGPIICEVDLDDVPDDTAFFIGGFGVNEREYEHVKRKFDGRLLKECYGNILWTWAFSPAKGYKREFYPNHPYVTFDVADIDDSKTILPYGEEGQVITTRLTRDMFFRWKERDIAKLIRPKGQFDWNGVSDLGPLKKM